MSSSYYRSDKGSNPYPRLVFSILRIIDPFIQYSLIFNGYGQQILSKLGIRTHPVGLTGYILVGMSIGSSIKQIINMNFILESKVPCSIVLAISTYNTLVNTISSLSSLVYSPSNQFGFSQYIGITLFTIGISAELLSEIQRKIFKNNPLNKGKLYVNGLFSVARHINYGGYLLWRTGFALTSGNLWWSMTLFVWHFWDFNSRAIPELNNYCQMKYGEQWNQFKNNVHNVLLPYLW